MPKATPILHFALPSSPHKSPRNRDQDHFPLPSLMMQELRRVRQGRFAQGLSANKLDPGLVATEI